MFDCWSLCKWNWETQHIFISPQKWNSSLILSLFYPLQTPSSSPNLHLVTLSNSVGSLFFSCCHSASLAPSLRAEANHALRPCSHCVPSATSVWGLCVPLISRGAMLGPKCVSGSVCFLCVYVCPLPSLRSHTGRPAWEVSAALYTFYPSTPHSPFRCY